MPGLQAPGFSSSSLLASPLLFLLLLCSELEPDSPLQPVLQES